MMAMALLPLQSNYKCFIKFNILVFILIGMLVSVCCNIYICVLYNKYKVFIKKKKLVFVASLQNQGVRSKTDLLGIRILCSSGEAILPTDFFFSELTL